MSKTTIKNAAGNKILGKDAVLCSGALSKFLGLMFSMDRKRALIFEFREEKIIALHMFFVFYRIDVLFLDKNKMVVDKKEDFKPFTFYTSRKKSKYAVELPGSTIKNTGTKIGDRISF